MTVSAMVFVAISRGDALQPDGWAIPADIAFAIGVLVIVGSRVPIAMRVLLISITIVDDLLVILVIVLFCSIGIVLGWLLAACDAALFVLDPRSIHAIWSYLLVGVVPWVAVCRSGLHATLAGVILAFVIPASATNDLGRSSLKMTEHAIDRRLNFGVLPIWGFTNAGIAFLGMGRDDLFRSLPIGIALGLCLGKQVASIGTFWILIRPGVAHMPAMLRAPPSLLHHEHGPRHRVTHEPIRRGRHSSFVRN